MKCFKSGVMGTVHSFVLVSVRSLDEDFVAISVFFTSHERISLFDFFFLTTKCSLYKLKI